MFSQSELKRLVEKEARDFFTLNHINRCFKNLELIKEKEFDEEIVSAGILLHCSGFYQSLKFNQNLIQTSLNLAKKFLTASNFPKEKTDAVLYCVSESGLKGKPKTIEAVLVHDTNLLDELTPAGLIKNSVLFYVNKISLNKFLEQQKTKSFLLKEAFFSFKAKKLAEQKIVFFDSFVEELEKQLK